MKILCSLFLVFIITFSAAAQPSNDECISADPITVVESTANTISVSMLGATESNVASCEISTNNYNDVWYSFTPDVSGNVRIFNNHYQTVVSLYETCGGIELGCFTGNGFFYNLSNSITYRLKVARRSDQVSSSGMYSFDIQAHSQAANDSCTQKIFLNVTESAPLTVNFDTRGASEDVVASCENPSQIHHDLWYSFTAPVTGNIRISNTHYQNKFSFYDDCGTAELRCFGSGAFFYQAVAGHSYTLRVNRTAGESSGPFSFDIQAYSRTPNDSCSQKIFLNVTESAPLTVNFDTRGASEDVIASCENTYQIHHDLWYSFTAPVTGNIRISNTHYQNKFSFYDDCGTAELRCFGSGAFFYQAVAGHSYTLRVNRTAGESSGPFSFDIQAYSRTPNDSCSQKIFLNVTESTPLTVNFDTRGASEDVIASCENPSQIYHDLWYSFTAPVTGNIRISNTHYQNKFSFYDDCGTAELTCFGSGAFFYQAVAGHSYTLRVNRTAGESSGPFSFDIQAYSRTPNDSCSQKIFLNVTESAPLTVNFDTRGASEDVVASCENPSQIQHDLWYSFTAPVTGNIHISNTNFDNHFSFYDDCGTAELTCFGDDGFFYQSIAGHNYTLRVSRTGFESTGPFSFDIQAYIRIPNDVCSTAYPAQVNYLCENGATNSVQLLGATQSGDDPNCVLSNYLDGWFVFDSPINGDIEVKDSDLNTGYAFYDACPPNLANPLACFIGNGILPGVSLGQTIYLQVWKEESSSGLAQFCLEAPYAVSDPGQGNCISASVMIDATNNDQWVHILDANNDIICSIDANGQNLGQVNVDLKLDLMNTRSYNVQDYLRREVKISPAVQPTTDVLVRIYLLSAELSDLIAVDPNLNSIAGLNSMKTDQSGCTNGYDGSGVFIDCGGFAYKADYFIEFTTNSFSTFFPSSVDLTPLPIELISFSGETKNNTHHLVWSTATEVNTSFFDIEHSQDAKNWEVVGSVKAAGNSQVLRRYQFDYSSPWIDNFYRLKIVDFDGFTEYSKIISLVNDKPTLEIFPNPASGYLYISSDQELKQIEILDVTGRTVFFTNKDLKELNVAFLERGVYYLRINHHKLRRFVKL